MMMVNGIRIMVSPQHSIEQLVQSPVKPRERSICHILWLRVTRLSDQESILPPSSHVTWRGSKSCSLEQGRPRTSSSESSSLGVAGPTCEIRETTSSDCPSHNYNISRGRRCDCHVQESVNMWEETNKEFRYTGNTLSPPHLTATSHRSQLDPS